MNDIWAGNYFLNFLYMKETFYFSHDYNARNDWKLVKVMMKHGLEWIGAYWCIIEMLYEEWGYISINEYERIAFELRTTENVIVEVINDFGLFTIWRETFYSQSVIDRLEQRMSKSEKARISVQKRWDKNKEENTNVLQTYNDSNTIKESKEKKNKEKNISKDTEQAPKYEIQKIEEDEVSKEIQNHLIERTVEIVKEYWDKDINKTLAYISKLVWCTTFKESQKQQRIYWKHLFTLWKEIWVDEFNFRLKEILSDPFKSKNCNKLAYLYWEIKSFIHSPVVEPEIRPKKFITSV